MKHLILTTLSIVLMATQAFSAEAPKNESADVKNLENFGLPVGATMTLPEEVTFMTYTGWRPLAEDFVLTVDPSELQSRILKRSQIRGRTCSIYGQVKRGVDAFTLPRGATFKVTQRQSLPGDLLIMDLERTDGGSMAGLRGPISLSCRPLLTASEIYEVLGQ